MAKKVLTKQELLDNREQLVAEHYATHRRCAKKRVLTKKERKVLGIGKDRGVASVKHVRISPSKVSIVRDIIIGQNLREALAILRYTPKAASPILSKLLESAAANAVNNNNLNRDNLYVAELNVGKGPTMKRYIPRGKGSASSIMKRTANISVVLKEREA